MEIETLGANARGNDWGADAEGLHNLEPGAAADAQRDDLKPGAFVVRADVWHATGHSNAGVFCVGSDFRARILPNNQNIEIWDFPFQAGVNFSEVPSEGVDVRIIIHRAAKDNGRFRGARFVGRGGVKEIEID